MSGLKQGDVFDNYCRAILEVLYEERGAGAILSVERVAARAEDLTMERRLIMFIDALTWLERSGLIKGREEPVDKGEFPKWQGNITEKGILLLGHPLPGSRGIYRASKD